MARDVKGTTRKQGFFLTFLNSEQIGISILIIYAPYLSQEGYSCPRTSCLSDCRHQILQCIESADTKT